MQKITPNLWFNDQAEAAAHFYASTFPNSKIGTIARYDKAGAEVSGRPEGSALTVQFELAGQQFVGLNGGPYFQFNPSISFHYNCSTKNETDEIWEKLSAGGETLMPLGEYPFSERFGWCNDQYGVSWQVIFVDDGELAQKITPALMFVGNVSSQAENAMNFYTSLFENAKMEILARYGKDEAPDQEGTVKYASFTLAGQEFRAMDSAHAHNFAFNEAVSFIVDCQDQPEVDYFWEKFTGDGGEESMCGWLKDRYGVSWQIVPSVLAELMGSDDQEKAGRAMKALLEMKKIDISKLKEAYAA